jgi:hypothetical protein
MATSKNIKATATIKQKKFEVEQYTPEQFRINEVTDPENVKNCVWVLKANAWYSVGGALEALAFMDKYGFRRSSYGKRPPKKELDERIGGPKYLERLG